MPHGKDSFWSGSLPGILAVAIPFLLRAWLLAQNTRVHIERYDNMAQVLEGFRQGLAIVEPLETMRDLAAANTYLAVPEINQRYAAARQETSQRLSRFLATIRGFDNNVLNNTATRVEDAWRELGDDANVVSNPMVPFATIDRFNGEIHAATSSLFFVSDMDAGEQVNARELLVLALDSLRRARYELGTVRSLAVYTALRDGYLASSEADALDGAWSELNNLEKALRTEVNGLALRDPGLASVETTGLDIVRDYLLTTEESLIMTPRIGTDWQQQWDAGELALGALRDTGNGLVDAAGQLVDNARTRQLRIDLATALGVILFYVAITALAVLFFRTRYAAMTAQAENRAKSLFLARMSHEIRTPLNGVIGLAELLADTQPTPRQQEYIELIGNSGRSLVSLVNDILDHAKIEAGKLDLERTPVDIRALVTESAQVFGLRAGEHRTLIFCMVDNDVPAQLLGDPTRIRQVLLNLIGNAVKFTERGRIEVHVGRTLGNDGTPRLRVEVRDTGIGLSPAEQQNLFSLFTQASPDVSRRFGGTGLGLSISRELVRLMEGSIGVYSGVGAGSVFWFELPLAAATAAAAPAAGAEPAIRPLPAPVLLVDAEGHLARAVAALPGGLAQPVTVANGATDARRALELRPDLRLAIINGQRHPEDAVAIAAALRAGHPGLAIRLLFAVGFDASTLPGLGELDADVVSRSVFAGSHLVALLTPPGKSASVAAPTHTGKVRTVLPPGLHVLVAEDNPVNQLVTRGLLQKLGVVVDVVADGRLAVERYLEQQGGYDLVLMDIDMPVLDGNAATRAIRKLETSRNWRRCPILALSAHALPEYGVMASEAGMDGHIVKPVTLAALADTLRAHVTPRRAPPDGDYNI
ncbi:MAG: ATP-binding protein [Gammaproteobacteria bacterium]